MKAEEYLKNLIKPISDSNIRNEITEEYQAHIEDCKAALMETGLSETEAEEEAVLQMGDPIEAGFSLGQVYDQKVDRKTLNRMNDIENIVSEEITLQYYQHRNGTVPQFILTDINHAKLDPSYIILIDLDKEKHPVTRSSVTLIAYHIGIGDNPYGILDLFICQKKKHLLKESLETKYRFKLHLKKDEEVSLTTAFPQLMNYII